MPNWKKLIVSGSDASLNSLNITADLTGSNALINTLDVSGSINLEDGVKLNIGTGNDLQLYHTGTGTVIQNLTGNLTFQEDQNDGDIAFRSDDGSGGTTEYFRVDGGAVKTIASKNFAFTDNVKAEFGDSGDLQIYHNGNNSEITHSNTGSLLFKTYVNDMQFINYATDGVIYFKTDNGAGGTNEYMRIDGAGGLVVFSKDVKLQDNDILRFGNANDLKIYHDASNSYISQQGTGHLYIENTQDNNDIIFRSDDGSGGVTPYLQLDGSHSQTIAWKNIHFVDGVKALFGDYATPDLEIYHDGSNSYIKETGTGRLVLSGGSDIQLQSPAGELMADFNGNGSVDLYHNNSKKFETTSTGVSVTGDITTSGNIILSGASNEIIKSNGSIRLNIDSNNDQTDSVFIVSTGANSEVFRVSETGYVTAQSTIKSQNGILALGNDVTLFRDGANILRTDDTFHANNSIHVGGDGKVYDRANTSNYIELADTVNISTDTSVTGDLTVTGKVTAQEFHTEFVSASIMYESGSTKFGDTSDDNHDFTGSINITGDTADLIHLKTTTANVGHLKLESTHISRIRMKSGTSIGEIFMDGVGGAISGGGYIFNTPTARNTYHFMVNNTPEMSLVAGNLGIGTGYLHNAAPKDKLDVSGSITIRDIGATRGIRRDNDAYDLRLMGGTSLTDGAYISLGGDLRGGAGNAIAGKVEIAQGGAAYATRSAISSSMAFNAVSNAGTTTDMLIQGSTGNVGIGTQYPSTKLHISGSTGASSGIRQSRSGTKIWTQEIDSNGKLQWAYRTTEAGSATQHFTLNDTGQAILHQYGSGNFTGTAAKTLAVDSSGNIIETDGGGSGTVSSITGGADTRVAYFNGSDSLEGSANFTWDDTQLTVVGDVEADEFIGDLRGAVLFKAQAGEALSKGDAVYISGISGNTTLVSKADADDTNKMPAFGIASAAASLNNPVDIYTVGTLKGIDTSGFTIGDELYVSSSAGELTATPPTGESSLIQKIAKVTRVDNAAGSIKISGAGRTNATPNLNEGRLFVGNASNQAVADGTVHVDIANSRVGIGTTSPNHKLDIESASSAASIRLKRADTGDSLILLEGSSYGYLQNTTGPLGLGGSNDDRDILIDTSGNVGIGTTSPSEKLDVNGNLLTRGDIVSRDTYPSIFVDHSGTVMGGIRADATNKLELKTLTTAPLSFQVNSSEKMRIQNNGNVGIGTTSPSSKFQVSANDGDGITLKHGASNAFYILRDGNDDTIIKQTRNYTSKISISTLADSGTHDSSGLNIVGQGSSLKSNVGIGTDSPSEKLQVDGNIHASGSGSEIITDQIFRAAQGTIRFRKGTNTWDAMMMSNNGKLELANGGANDRGEIYLHADHGSTPRAGVVTFENESEGTSYLFTDTDKRLKFHTSDPGEDDSLGEKVFYNNFPDDATFAGNITVSNTITTPTDTNLSLSPNGTGHIYFGNAGNGMRLYHYSNANDGKYTTHDFNGSYYRLSTTATSGVKIGNPLYVSGNTDIEGDLTVNGKVTAQEFHTEFVSASIMYESGSTKFGDTSNDIHSFTGSLNTEGEVNISGNLKLTGSLDFISGSSIEYDSNDISTWHLNIDKFYVGGQDTSPEALFFKPDGTKMYILGRSGDDIDEYALSTAWDVTTATYTDQLSGLNSSPSSEDNPYGMFISPDGLQLYIVGHSQDQVIQWTMSVAWDISTASYTREETLTKSGGNYANPNGIHFKPDGTRFWVVGAQEDLIQEYTLSTAWDVSTLSLGNSFSLLNFFTLIKLQPTGEHNLADISSVEDLFFSEDGYKVWVTDNGYDTILQLNLSTAWNITTATYGSKAARTSPYQGSVDGLYVNEAEGKAFTCSTGGDYVRTYNIGGVTFNSTNDSSVGIKNGLNVKGDSVFNGISSFQDIYVSNGYYYGSLNTYSTTSLTHGNGGTINLLDGTISNTDSKLDVQTNIYWGQSSISQSLQNNFEHNFNLQRPRNGATTRVNIGLVRDNEGIEYPHAGVVKIKSLAQTFDHSGSLNIGRTLQVDGKGDLEAFDLTGTTVFLDTFTESSTTALESHTPDTGAGWTKVFDDGDTNTWNVIGGTGVASLNASDSDDGIMYLADTTPSSVNYEVRVDFQRRDSGDDTFSIIIKYKDANNYYALQWSTSYSTYCRLIRVEGGSIVNIQNNFGNGVMNQTTDNLASGLKLRYIDGKLMVWDIDPTGYAAFRGSYEVTTDFNDGDGGTYHKVGMALGDLFGGTLDATSTWKIDKFEVKNLSAASVYAAATTHYIENGNVGIGTNNPTAALHVESSEDTVLRVKSTDNKAIIALSDDDTNGYISSENSKLSLGANSGVNANNLNIDLSNNRVGIGTSSPTTNLDVRGGMIVAGDTPPSAYGATLEVYRNGNTSELLIHQDDDTATTKFAQLHFRNGGNDTYIKTPTSGQALIIDTESVTDAVGIRTDGRVGIGTITPNDKLDVQDGYLRVGFTGGAQFKLIPHSSNNGYGFYDVNNSNYDIWFQDGDVGIGTGAASPGSRLDIKSNSTSSSESGIRVVANSSSNPVAAIGEKSNGKGRFHLYDSGNAKVSFYADGTDNYIASGNVGIGTTNPGAKFHIDVVSEDNQPGFKLTKVSDSGENAMEVHHGTSSALRGIADFTNSNGSVMFLRGDGNVGIGTTSPSAKLDVDGVIRSRGGTYTADTDTKTDVGIVIPENDFIYTADGSDYLRKLIGKTSDIITIGEAGTSLIDGISLKPGGSGGYVQIYNNATVAAKFVDGNVGIGTTSPGATLPTDSETASKVLQLTGVSGNTGDTAVLLRSSDNSSGLDLWHNASSGDSYIDNRFNAAQGDTIFRVKTAGTPLEALRITGDGKVGIGTTNPGAKLDIEGDLQVKGVNISNQENLDVDTGTETIATVVKANYDAAFFDFVIKNGTNLRAGTVFAIHDGTNVEFTETSTNDLGDTSAVTLAVDISGTDMRLRATTTSDNWIIKSLVRTI